MSQPSARVVADSVSPAGHRLTTMEVVVHRFVLAEFNTHRRFSRNSASSRAIPFAKQLERVTTDPAIPVVWAAEQRGMQGGDEIEEIDRAEGVWLDARDVAVEYAKELSHIGIHKSIVNRLLEPFMWHTIVVTSTDWGNFFSQRCSPLAQPEIRLAAEAMQGALAQSAPRLLSDAQWHLPYVEEEDEQACERCGENPLYVSAARCARVSYLTQDGRRDVQEDAALYQRLVKARPMHASPLEHVARPERVAGEVRGNFRGWVQLRQLIEAQEGIDSTR